MGNYKKWEVQSGQKDDTPGDALDAGGETKGQTCCRIQQALLASEDADTFKKKCRCPEFCPVDSVLDIFSGKWTVKILYALFVFGRMRFGELQRHIGGISKTMLSSTLKMLEERGLVIREQFNEIPPHVEYSLTEGGEAMQDIFVEIARWSSKYLK